MHIFYTDHFVLPLPDGHRFPMAKYAALRERVAAAKLGELAAPPPATDEQLSLVHDPGYVARVVAGDLSPREIRNLGFPWSPEMVERSRRSVGATIAAADRALATQGYGVNLAGGTHHAYAERGEGFCVFNDVAVAIAVLRARGAIHRPLVVDLDVHQGNGTAVIFKDDPQVFTLSVHGRGNYPFRKERSDLDLALPDGTSSAAYLEALAPKLDQAFARHEPDMVFYLAGADPYEHDRLGKLGLDMPGLADRDALVYDHCDRADLPIAVAMAGGYAESLDDIVTIHFQSVRAAAERHRDRLRPS